MPKAILELPEMPESCRECMFKECLNSTTSVEVSRCIILHKMHVPGSYCPAEGRQADCPLKLVDEHCRNAEWVNGKCRGHRISPYTYEVLVQCKNCKDFEEYKGVE